MPPKLSEIASDLHEKVLALEEGEKALLYMDQLIATTDENDEYRRTIQDRNRGDIVSSLNLQADRIRHLFARIQKELGETKYA